MAGSSKNLGQVAGLYIGTSAPTNKALIWYDTSSNVHKTFDVGLNAWTVLQPQTITSITYSALVSRASGQGLTQGQWFKITDRSNALALAITATKVQYVNNNGVPVVDDLGTHVMYNVTSENLIIDDVTGVYDATTNKLTFSFSETTPVMNTGDSDVDYVLGEQKRGNNKTLRKFRLSSLLSAVTGNDISWNGGFFLNFYNKLKSYFDTTGGVASHAALEEYKTLNNQAIEDMTQTAQDAIQTVGQNINQATASAQIYGKQLPIAPTDGVTADIAQGDTLSGIVVKIHRWINKFKKADGIAMPANYAPASNASPVNNNDNVSSAIGKLSKYATNHNTGDGIQVSNSTFVPASEDPGAIVKTDSLLTAIKKLYWLAKNINTIQILDHAVTLDKIAKYGVLPTDIFRVDLHTSNFNIDGCGLGCILVQGSDNNFFNYDPYHPDDPYRIRIFYNSAFPKILAFAPVAQIIPNSNNNYSIAAAFVHFNAEGVTCQVLIQLSESKYADLYTTSGYRVLKGTITADVYDDRKTPVNFNIALNRVNILNINFSHAILTVKNYQHIILDLEMEAAVS